ncbi:hypothetical protein CBG28_18900, partial [Vibrio cholerae O139]
MAQGMTHTFIGTIMNTMEFVRSLLIE